MWIGWLVYTLYITKENEYINIKIKDIRRECKKKGIILIKRQKDKIEAIDYSNKLGCDYSSATTSILSHFYHNNNISK